MDQPPSYPTSRLQRESVALEDRLAQALVSRICHDLVSPVGAVVNGVDLARELAGAGGAGSGPGEESAEVTSMIAESAGRAANLLAFHRLTFGAADADSQPMARPALAEAIAAHLEGPRVTLALDGLDGPPLPRLAARSVALLMLAARGLIGLRGRVVGVLDPQAHLPVRVLAEGYDAERKAPLFARLAGPEAETAPDPRTIEFLLAPRWARTAGARLTASAEGDLAELTLSPV